MLLVQPTDRGRQVADQFRPVVHQHQKVWLGVLGKDEQQQMIDSLQRLQATLSDSET